MRPHIVALARAWIGTPYHHQASAQGRRHRLHRPRPRRLARALRPRGRGAPRLHPRLGRGDGPRDAARSRPPPPHRDRARATPPPATSSSSATAAPAVAKHAAILATPDHHDPRHGRRPRVARSPSPPGGAATSPRVRTSPSPRKRGEGWGEGRPLAADALPYSPLTLTSPHGHPRTRSRRRRGRRRAAAGRRHACSAPPSPAPRSAPRSARSPAPSSTRRCSAPSGQPTVARPAPLRPARHRLVRRRADPAPLRPRAPRRPDHLGHRLRGGGGRTQAQPAAAARAAAAAAADHARIEYRYFANFAVALSEGPITGIGRVWADGKRARSLDRSPTASTPAARTSSPDSLIEAKEGAGNAPAYRGLAYIVFERLPLAAFGNRIPQLSFEVLRAVDAFEQQGARRRLIPGAGEFVYAPTVRHAQGRRRHQRLRERAHPPGRQPTGTSPSTSCRRRCPNVGAVVARRRLVRHRSARRHLRRSAPASTPPTRSPRRSTWSVAGLTRARAHLVSHDRRPRGLRRHAVGRRPSSPPSRTSKARGIAVTLAPFIFMDMPAGNALPDPYTGAASQPAYPWRGRITVLARPRPARHARQDRRRRHPGRRLRRHRRTSRTSPSSTTSVVYSGPAEWSYRRFILHYAHLAAAAGGVDAFVIGSELRGLTTVRDSASTYPFVAALADLAADVKAVLGSGTKVTYAADWSEYFGHQPADGSGDVYFHLDPLWSSRRHRRRRHRRLLAALRLARRHRATLDRLAGAASIYDLAYLRGNIAAGEGYDWYYASPADRDAQMRTPITDGARQALGVPLQGHPHLVAQPALQSPRRRRIRHAHRLGAAVQALLVHRARLPRRRQGRQPAQRLRRSRRAPSSLLPYYSQRHARRLHAAPLPAGLPRGLRSRPTPDYIAGANPVSSVYGGRMVDLDHVHVYAGTRGPIRPSPPTPTSGATAPTGGSATGSPAASPARRSTPPSPPSSTTTASPPTTPARSPASLAGFLIDRVLSAREALQPLRARLLLRRARERGPHRLRPPRRRRDLAAELDPDDLVESRPGAALATLTRAQETDLPSSAKLTFISAAGSYPAAVEEARRLAGHSGRVAVADLPLVLERRAGRARWPRSGCSRPGPRASAPPSPCRRAGWRSSPATSSPSPPTAARACCASPRSASTAPATSRRAASTPTSTPAPHRRRARAPAARRVIVGQPFVLFLDLPLLRGDEPPARRLRRRRPEPLARRHRLLSLARKPPTSC